MYGSTKCQWLAARAGLRLCGAGLLVTAAGCAWLPAKPVPDGPKAAVFRSADTAFTSPGAVNRLAEPLPATRPIELSVLHVQIPRDKLDQLKAAWAHANEQQVDAHSELLLQQNGIRVGVCHTQWWGVFQDALNSIPDQVAHEQTAVVLQPGFPLAMELDAASRDQTIFYVQRDGSLEGQTWPASRNVLRIAHSADARGERVRLRFVPAIRQESPDLRFASTEAGAWRMAASEQLTPLPAASFSVSLQRDEFVIIASSDDSAPAGLLGGAMLTGLVDGRPMASYLFIRPKVPDVAASSD